VKPLGLTATSRHPLIVSIHGGPHGQRGTGLQLQNQIYANGGCAVLMVNYPGSTGYGQGSANAVFRGQNGDEGQDVLYGLSAAKRRNLLDRSRAAWRRGGGSYKELWRRSSLRYVGHGKTPTMLMNGENDNDVPIAESERFYIGRRDAGVEAALTRYPPEGHGLREPKHTVHKIERSIRWYEAHFPGPQSPSAVTFRSTNATPPH